LRYADRRRSESPTPRRNGPPQDNVVASSSRNNLDILASVSQSRPNIITSPSRTRYRNIPPSPQARLNVVSSPPRARLENSASVPQARYIAVASPSRAILNSTPVSQAHFNVVATSSRTNFNNHVPLSQIYISPTASSSTSNFNNLAAAPQGGIRQFGTPIVYHTPVAGPSRVVLPQDHVQRLREAMVTPPPYPPRVSTNIHYFSFYLLFPCQLMTLSHLFIKSTLQEGE